MSHLLHLAWACAHGGQFTFKRIIRSMHCLLDLRLGHVQYDFCCCIYWSKQISCPIQMKGVEKQSPSFDGRGHKVILQHGGYFCTFCFALKVSFLWAMSLSPGILTQLENIIRKRSVTTMLTTFVLNVTA